MATKTNSAHQDSGAVAGAVAGATGAAPPLPQSYEQARDELATVVEALEAGGLSLDESLTLWERGQSLAKACETFLAGARRRVEAALAEESTEAADPSVDPR